jgi:hypothetical protein
VTETETPTTTAEAVRFNTRGRADALEQPIPERLLATVPAKLRADHERLVGERAQNSRTIARLRQELEQAPHSDRRAAARAMRRGDEFPEPSAPGLERELDEAVRVRGPALDQVLIESADELLAAAAGHAAKVADELDGELDALADKVRAALAAAAETLGEFDALVVQAQWTRSLSIAAESGQPMSPFRAARMAAFTDTSGELRRAGEAFEHDLGKIVERRREAEAWAREQAAQNAEAAAARKASPAA